MITREQVIEVLEPQLVEDGYYIVEVKVRKGNVISVSVDGDQGVTIEYIKKISRLVESSFDREIEDFELEVGSPGIGKPFRVIQQYYKSIGKVIEVTLLNESKIQGVLLEVNPEGFSIEAKIMEKREGEKRKTLHIDVYHYKFEEVKAVIDIITF